MSAYPKISIVTPSYNQGKYLEQTILSVLNQNYPNLEYIVIDGGSTDNSIEIIKKYAHKISYWTSEKDEGLYYALQKGFNISSGEIMAWINSDDMYNSKSLFAVAEIMKTFPQINWLMGKNTFFNEDSQSFVFHEDKYQERWSKWRLYRSKGAFIQQESVFWRRSLWEKAGSYIESSLNLAADLELWVRFFKYADMYTTNVMLAGFRFRNENQKSRDHFEEYMSEVKSVLNRNIKENNDSQYLCICGILDNLSKLIPFRKLKTQLRNAAYRFPPKVIFLPQKGFTLKK
jgi:glycosyltransferase involved in cell wall biosynthesis